MDAVEQVVAWVGRRLTDDQRVRLGRFGEWLRAEAIPAGGLGDAEAERIEGRHLADSLAFLAAWPSGDPPSLLDLGAGVGLPGIPLAIVLPETQVVLVDRSRRRTRLARRAVRILGLDNVDVVQSEIEAVETRVPAIVSRAAMPLETLRPQVLRLLLPGGVGVVGGSRAARPADEEDPVIEIPATVLDPPGWLRMITRQ